jgi:hypothetical protein
VYRSVKKSDPDKKAGRRARAESPLGEADHLGDGLGH